MIGQIWRILNDLHAQIIANSQRLDDLQSQITQLRQENSQSDNTTQSTDSSQPNFVISENQKIQKSPQEQLFEAIKNGNLADVSNATKNGADVNAIGWFGLSTPLHEAAKNGYFKIVKYLLQC